MKQTITKEQVYLLAEQSFGIVPPLIKEIAEKSVPSAALYLNGVITMHQSVFSEVEINAIELRISTLNGCGSCVKGHSYLLKKAGLDENDIRAITEGCQGQNESINSLMRATDAVFRATRNGFENELTTLEAEGVNETMLMEIISLLSLKTISNHINNYLKATKEVARAAA